MKRFRAAVLASTALMLLAATPAWSDEPKARVQGELDKTLRLMIQKAIGETATKPNSRLDARRRAREAGEAVIAVLRSEGYYDYQVEPDVSESDPPEPLVRITPGPRYLLSPAAIDWQDSPPNAEAEAAAAKAMKLTPGSPGRAIDVLAAEGRVVAAVRQHGYADAQTRPRQVVVDHADRSMHPTFKIAAGDLVKLDGVRLVTKGRTNPAWVASLTPWKHGAPYDPDKLAILERRLTDAGVYQSVSVALAPKDQIVDGERPVIVSLTDRAPHTIEAGAGYSTTEGAGVDLKWIRYNRLGRADTFTVTARLAQIQQKLDAELDLPHWRRADQTLKLGADLFGDRTKAYDDDGVGLRADVERRFTKTTYITVGGALDYADTRAKVAVNANSFPVGQDLKLVIVTGLTAFALDRSNDILNPTRGWRLEVRAEPTYITGDRTLSYLKTQAQLSGYLPIGRDAGTVIAARLHVGSIIGGDIPDVPADRRFFAGGGGSVRGYTYQGVGPRLSDNTPEGGLGLFEASVEVRQKVTDRWSVVGFIDAGSVSLTQTPNFSQFSAGAGVGVRYDLGFGPIRFDLATPLNPRKGDPAVQIYISIGQSF